VLAMGVDATEWHREQEWLRAEAKKARTLTADEERYLDAGLAKRLKERVEQEASLSWWQLFGVDGHYLDSEESEAQYISHLDKIFKCPAASLLIAPAQVPRRSYKAYHFTRKGTIERVEFTAPKVSRLLELMLYGYFPYEGIWIYLDRRRELTADGFQKPKQWLALPPGVTPKDRLGITIEILIGRRWVCSDTPQALFSNLDPAGKESFAREYGGVGSRSHWLECMTESAFYERGSRTKIRINYAGESGQHLTLAELLANGGNIPGKQVMMQDGNFLNCYAGNLITRSSRGRRMSCHTCRMPTNRDHSEIVKDSFGSSLRLCHSCMAWMVRTKL
jgi:hypothetical protein